VPFEKQQPAEFHVVSRGYADVLGLRTAEGRWFSGTDTSNTRAVAVINEAMARRYFRGKSPIGVRLQGSIIHSRDWPREWEVVGVVREPERAGTDRETPPAMYVPWEQAGMSTLTVLVRTTDSARKSARLLRGETLGIRRGIVEVRRMQTGTDVVSEASARARFVSDQLGVLGVLALAVAGVGIYSIVSFQTSRRLREMAIRMAVGSTAAGVFRVVVAETVGQVVFGIAAGVPIAWGVLRAMGSLRPELTPAASVPYLATALLCFGLAVVGAAPAAWRAASTDPMRTLYTE
jgi:putative ABC transport system permease protein